MNITLIDSADDQFMNEAVIVQQALRGRVQYYEEKRDEHNGTGATLAAWMYQRRAWTLRGVLKREFGDELL